MPLCARVLPVMLAVTVAPARADAAPTAVAIHYTAPAGCPSEADMVSRLIERAPVVRVVSTDVLTLDLTLADAGGEFHGTLSLREPGGAATTREVTAPTCDDVVTALVLVATLAIEDRASEAVIAAPPPHVTRIAPEARWQLAFGAGVARYAGVTPHALVGVPLYLAAVHRRLRLRATFDATASEDLGTTQFRWIAGRLDACPYTVRAGRLDAAPCAGIQVGALTGEGTMVAAAAQDTRPWLAPELTGRIGLRVGRARLELEATAAAPLVRDHYYIAPSTTVHQVPAVAVRLAASGEIIFW